MSDEVKAPEAEKSVKADKKAPEAEKSARELYFEYPTFTGKKEVRGFYTPESDEEYNRLAPHADKAPA